MELGEYPLTEKAKSTVSKRNRSEVRVRYAAKVLDGLALTSEPPRYGKLLEIQYDHLSRWLFENCGKALMKAAVVNTDPATLPQFYDQILKNDRRS